MAKKFKEIILRYGELQEVAKEMGHAKNTIHAAIKGHFNEYSRSYQLAMEIRRYILEKYPNRYKDINE